MTKRLFRTRSKKIAGVCGGFANYFNLDVTLLRVASLIFIFTPVPIILIYLISWIATPKEPLF